MVFNYFKSYVSQFRREQCLKKASKYYKKEDYSKAVYWFEKAANLGHANAQYLLGRMYEEGRIIKKDGRKAFVYYEQSAIQDHVDAQYALSSMYYEGEGVVKDLDQALLWFEKAEAIHHEIENKCLLKDFDDDGEASEQYHLGILFEKDKMFQTAFKYYQKAAIQGHMVAQYNLAVMYHKGIAVDQDHKKAMYWYQKSAAQGDHAACFILNVLKLNHLSSLSKRR